MQSKPMLTRADVAHALDAALAEAEHNGWKVTVAVVDDGGHPLGLIRGDGAAPVSALIALEKARSAALGQRETAGYEQMINDGRTAFLSAPLQGLLEGGVPVMVGGQCAGALGVSGVKPEQDAQVAKAGVAAVGSAH
jgi:glc operon protein GlcG